MNETAFNFIKPDLVKPNLADTPSRVSFTDKDKSELKKAARDFEAVFIGQLLKVMRETIEESEEGGGFGKGIYTELFDQEIAVSLAERGALGIGDIIYKSLAGQDEDAEGGEGGNAAEAPVAASARPRARHSHSGGAGAAPSAPSVQEAAVAADADAPETDAPDMAVPEIPDMMLPVHAPVSSPFGMRRDPFTGKPRFHRGIDIAAPAGTPVVAALPGTVVVAGREGGYGNTVMVEHEGGLRTRYAHLSSIDVRVGDRVTSDDVLGAVGSTGRSTGAHLHFEVIRMGKPTNPLLSAK